jgi:hypothetical protein
MRWVLSYFLPPTLRMTGPLSSLFAEMRNGEGGEQGPNSPSTPSLKGQCHEIFDHWFFSANNPTWAPDSSVKAFWHMASNSRSYSTKWVHHRIQLCKLGSKSHRTAGAASAVSLIPLVLPQRCHWHSWCRGPRTREALAALKGNINEKNYIGKLYYPIAITITEKK